MRSPGARRLGPLLVAGILAAGLAACSSSSGSTSTTSTASASGPELTSINLGILPVSDSVVVQIAEDEGIFKQEGFKSVHITVLKTLATSDQQLLSHTDDIVAENYVSMFSQQNELGSALNLRVIADLAQATPNLFVQMVPKGSTITSLAQLKGKPVACPALGLSYCQLSLDVLLKPYGLSVKNLKIVPVPFADVPAALSSNAVASAFITEPFITILEAKGARILQDMMTGPLVGAPQSCFGVTASFLKQYPRTVAAFQRAIAKADGIADSDPALVRQELPKLIKTLSPKLAQVIGLPTWNTTLSEARMERVANIMEEFGFLPSSFPVSQMYVPSPAS
jgi:NitT/TauT family transport system substrate-binding protein